MNIEARPEEATTLTRTSRRRRLLVALPVVIVAAGAGAFVATEAKTDVLVGYVHAGHEITHMVDRQTAYPESQQITKEGLENKYGIHLLSPQQADVALGISQSSNAVNQPDFTEAELHLLDQNLANLPPEMYAAYNGSELSIFSTSLPCEGQCGGEFSQALGIGGLIGLDGSDYAYNVKNPNARLILTHEMTHRVDFAKGPLEPAIQKILGNYSFMNLPEFADNSTVQVNSQTARAIIALSSLATPDPNPQNPHVNPVEGTAELAELYVGGYSAFMNAVGPELNSKGCRYYVGRPIVDALLQKEFPQADALYRFYQDNIFGGYGYGSQGNMISGKDAIPKQIGQVKFDTPSPSENPTTVLVDGQLIGTLNNGRIISIIRPSRATLAIFVPS